jgi:hypothetical protein
MSGDTLDGCTLPYVPVRPEDGVAVGIDCTIAPESGWTFDAQERIVLDAEICAAVTGSVVHVDIYQGCPAIR